VRVLGSSSGVLVGWEIGEVLLMLLVLVLVMVWVGVLVAVVVLLLVLGWVRLSIVRLLIVLLLFLVVSLSSTFTTITILSPFHVRVILLHSHNLTRSFTHSLCRRPEHINFIKRVILL